MLPARGYSGDVGSKKNVGITSASHLKMTLKEKAYFGHKRPAESLGLPKKDLRAHAKASVKLVDGSQRQCKSGGSDLSWPSARVD